MPSTITISPSFSPFVTTTSRPRSTPVVVAQPKFLNFAGPVLSGYLHRRVTYVLGHRVVRGSFMFPDVEHREGATDDEIMAQLHQFAKDRQTDVYVVTNNWEPPALGTPAIALPPGRGGSAPGTPPAGVRTQ